MQKQADGQQRPEAGDQQGDLHAQGGHLTVFLEWHGDRFGLGFDSGAQGPGRRPLSTSTGFNLLYIYAGYTMRNIEGIGESAANEKLEGIVRDRAAAREIDLSNPFSRAVLGREVGLEYISQNKIEFLKVHFGNIIPIYINSLSLKPFLGRVFSINTTIIVECSGEFRRTEFSFGKLKYLLENTELPVTVLLLLYAAFYILLYYVMAMIGLKVLWTNKYYEALFLLFIVVIYFTLISGSIGEPRYKLPISMMYVIPAAVGLTRAWDWLLKRKSIGIR